ncbi:MAG: LytTR family DNA-binding domain-containing protein [Hyphococcus sp.]
MAAHDTPMLSAMTAGLKDQRSVAAVAVAAWALLVLLFAATSYADAARKGVDATFAQALWGYGLGFLPWVALAPAVAAFSRRRLFSDTALARQVFEGGVLFGCVFIVLFLHMLFVYAPLTGVPIEKIAGLVGFQQWIWDVMIFIIALLAGRALAEPETDARMQPVQQAKQAAAFIVKSGKRVERVRANALLAVSAQGNYVALITEDREFLHRATLREMRERLAEDGFSLIHRSHLVRDEAISAVHRKNGRIREVTLSNGRQIPVSPQGIKRLPAAFTGDGAQSHAD